MPFGWAVFAEAGVKCVLYETSWDCFWVVFDVEEEAVVVLVFVVFMMRLVLLWCVGLAGAGEFGWV